MGNAPCLDSCEPQNHDLAVPVSRHPPCGRASGYHWPGQQQKSLALFAHLGIAAGALVSRTLALPISRRDRRVFLRRLRLPRPWLRRLLHRGRLGGTNRQAVQQSPSQRSALFRGTNTFDLLGPTCPAPPSSRFSISPRYRPWIAAISISDPNCRTTVSSQQGRRAVARHRLVSCQDS